MASYRSFPPQSLFGPPPSQNPAGVGVAPLQPQQRGNKYNQNWNHGGGDGGTVSSSAPSASFPQGYSQLPPNSGYHRAGYGSSTSHPYQQYPYPPPPPPPETSYPAPPPPPPPSMPQQNLQPRHAPPTHYPSNNYSQYNQQPVQPPPPSSPPPSSSIPLHLPRVRSLLLQLLSQVKRMRKTIA